MRGGNISTGTHHEEILRKTTHRHSRSNFGPAYYRGHPPVYPANSNVSSLVVQGVGRVISQRTNRAGRVACGE